MSSRARNAEKRREHDEAYEREYNERHAKEAEFRRRFGPLEARLEALGIEPMELVDYVKAKLDEAAQYPG